MRWKVLDTGPATAQENMAIDRALLKNLRSERQPILHFYEWVRPSITYGYFVDPYAHLNEQTINSEGIDLAARPTGGGIVLHLTDFAFSMLIPNDYPEFSSNTLQNYALINQQICEAIRISLKFNKSPKLFLCQDCSSTAPDFCMASPSAYDVICEGRKIAGGAQRRTRYGLLHQGTICTTSPSEKLVRGLVRDKKTCDAILMQETGNQLDRSILKEAVVNAAKAFDRRNSLLAVES